MEILISQCPRPFAHDRPKLASVFHSKHALENPVRRTWPWRDFYSETGNLTTPSTMRTRIVASLLFMLLASNGLCQTNETNGIDTPDIVPPCFKVVLVPKTTTFVTTTTVVEVTSVPVTEYGCPPPPPPPPPPRLCIPPCRAPYACIEGACTILT